MLITLHKFPYRYFAYEEEFLKQEARSVGKILQCSPGAVSVRSPGASARTRLRKRLARLTYFSHFQLGNSVPEATQQFLLESGSGSVGSASKRQATRYSAHGIHEYKGRFNPQIARFLINKSRISREGVVFDPFCGCGTVLVEAVHYGCRAVGIDSNPLAEVLTKAKLTLLRARDAEIQEFATSLRSIVAEVERCCPRLDMELVAGELGLGEGACRYLSAWFPRGVLAKLLTYRYLARKKLSLQWALVAETLASSIARDVSYQDPADLRIRRRKQVPLGVSPEYSIVAGLDALVARVKGANAAVDPASRGVARVFCADSREGSRVVRQALREFGRQRVDLVVTSPPYATALPYIDTSRLSLVLLGLGEPDGLKRFERLQIGSREILPSERNRWEREIDAELSLLPGQLSAFIRMLLREVKDQEVGFRRRNLPALLAAYFGAIRSVLGEMRGLLRPGGEAFWVVGKNTTEVGGRRIEIDTPTWIAAIGESIGLAAEAQTLDTYQRFGLHHRNAIRSESLLTFRPA